MIVTYPLYQVHRPTVETLRATAGSRELAICRCTCGRCGAPPLVAFTGKRQYVELMTVGRADKKKVTKVDFGRQAVLPAASILGLLIGVLHWLCGRVVR